VNVAFFSSDPGEGIRGEFMDGIGNTIAAFLVFAFFQGKFFLLFSFLFGYSAQYIVGPDSKSVQRWLIRAIALIVFGFLHFTFLWYGDILFLYGVLGLFLPFFFKRKDHILKRWSWGIYLAASLFLLLVAIDEYSSVANPSEAGPDISFAEIMRHGSYLESITPRLHLWSQTIGTEFLLQGGLVFSAFLVGILFARKRSLASDNPSLNRRRMMTLGFGIGVPIQLVGAIVFVVNENSEPISNDLYHAVLFFSFVTAPILTIGYVGMILWALDASGRLVPYMRFAGRMSLTNYFLESVALSFIFGPWGLGLFQRIDFWLSFVIAVLIWIVLLKFSQLWLSRFRQGPGEWVLAKMTHW
jgi:uncharacterized protein